MVIFLYLHILRELIYPHRKKIMTCIVPYFLCILLVVSMLHLLLLFLNYLFSNCPVEVIPFVYLFTATTVMSNQRLTLVLLLKMLSSLPRGRPCAVKRALPGLPIELLLVQGYAMSYLFLKLHWYYSVVMLIIYYISDKDIKLPPCSICARHRYII